MRRLTFYLRRSSLALFVVLLSMGSTTAQTTAFKYQGQLPDDYNQPTAPYDIQFNLYDEVTGSNPPLNAAPLVLDDVQVTNGSFAVSLDFGNLFDGSNRYLEIGVRPGNSAGAFTVLSPRQQITSSPYAVRSLSAAAADTATSAQSLNGTAAAAFVQGTDPRLTDVRQPAAGSDNYIQNAAGVQSGATFNIEGAGMASVFDATVQFNIDGNRVLSAPGVNNIFVAGGAGAANTAGHGNSFFGTQAGYGNTTGSFNSFFGVSSGLGSITGMNNTLIGANADAVTGNLSYATAIGSNARVGASDTVVLGKVAGTYAGQARPADTVQIPGNLNVAGTISGNVSGINLTNLNASNIASGTLDSNRLGVVPVDKGGTGLTSAGASGNFLRSDGAAFTSSVLQAADVPDLSASYLRNTTTPQVNADFNISGSGVVGGNLSVGGTLDASGAGLTGLNATNVTTGTLDNARLGLIPTANIADGAISTPKIADSAVTAAKIGSNQVVMNLNGLTDNVSLVAGANVTITPSGNVLTISAAGGNFIQNTTTQQPGSSFNISGDGWAANLTASSTLSGNVVNAMTQFNVGGNRVLSSPGEENMFAGVGTGGANTMGSRNAFFGYNAGAANTTGRSNSFIGRQAGLSNITGINNTFVGSDAGTSNTTGSENQFVGASAGQNNTVGNGNSFFGTSAGNMNTEGVANSFYGNGAGIRTTTGGRNTFFGSSAGSINTTGGYNTVVGANADVVTNNLSYATAIGAGARVSTSNTIALGRSDGSDRVRVFGLGAAGSTQLCRNAANEISTCSSSLRYKTSISSFSPGLNLLRRLRPIRFEWKEGGMKDVGFGAEDVAAVEPLLVTYDAKGTVEGVKYDRISAVLVNAVKEQQMQIEAQQAQLKQQGAQIEGQQQQLRQQQVMIDDLKKLLCQQNANAKICR